MAERNRAALYLRLSKEDRDKLTKGDDSASIKNQRLLLTDFALQQDYQIAEVYSDDDESGLFDTRPDFERMITDAKLGKFDIVIAKSQSRFSRNMEHIEKYLHRDFPNLGIRFIGVVDGADTFNMGNKKSRQINGLVNEWYCEDLSGNIRSAFRAKMKAGQYLGASCPYGYIKDPKNHNHLIVDEYAAEVVKKIYRLYMKGCGKARIAKILTEEGILIPTLYKRKVLGINYRNSHEIDTTKYWSYQTVHTILNNEVYIGNVVQNKYNNLSYKDKKHIRQPKENWIRVTGMHEAIISPEIYKEVQERQRIRTKEVKGQGSASLFSGILFCADCHHAMVRKYERRGNHDFTGYCCKTYKTQSKKLCTSHAVNYEQLKETVLSAIQNEAVEILTSENIAYLNKMNCEIDRRKGYEFKLQYIESEIERKKSYKKNTYQNLMENILSKEEYLAYVKEYELDICALKKQKESLKKQIEEKDKQNFEYNEWLEKFKNYISIEELTRDVLLELVKKIEANEDGSVNIYYRFENPYRKEEKK